MVWITLAFAQDPLIPLHGSLTAANGAPLNGAQVLTVRLFDQPTGGSHRFEEEHTAEVHDGAFSLRLGATDPLTPADFAGARWIEIEVAGVPAPRVPVDAAPRALAAGRADRLGDLAPEDVVPASATLAPWLDDPQGFAGQLGAWLVSWGDGVVDIGARVLQDVADPIDPQDAATKAYVDGAVADFAGNDGYIHNGTAAQAASFHIGGNGEIDGNLTVTGALTVTGSVSLPGGGTAGAMSPYASAPACGAGQAGSTYFNTTEKKFYGCNGTGWVALDGGVPTSPNPAKMPVDVVQPNMTFSTDSVTGGNPAYIGDKHNTTAPADWTSRCVQTTNTNGVHWAKVDLGSARTITSFGVGGYPGGSHKPAGAWSLQGSNDDVNWTNVWTGTGRWNDDTYGSYPSRNPTTVTNPGSYRYYRVTSNNWTNGYLLLCELSLYELQNAPATGDLANVGYGVSTDSDYPGSNAAGPLDRINTTVAAEWTTRCFQSSNSGSHWYMVDLGTPQRVSSFGVAGYPGGSHKPSATWRLEGSANGSDWTVLATPSADAWTADTGGSYPPRTTNTIASPGNYRYYRVAGDAWANGYMIICNLALYR